jgi:hypothetical protein
MLDGTLSCPSASLKLPPMNLATAHWKVEKDMIYVFRNSAKNVIFISFLIFQGNPNLKFVLKCKVLQFKHHFILPEPFYSLADNISESHHSVY